jgi:hypothetical protein
MQLDFLKWITPFSDDDYDPDAVPRSSDVERQISRIISHGAGAGLFHSDTKSANEKVIAFK